MAIPGIRRLTRALATRGDRLYRKSSQVASKSSLVVRKALYGRRYRNRFLILDDLFPVLLSPFRIAEYNAYLNRYPSAEAHSTGTAFPYLRETRSFAEVRADYESLYPAFKGRVHSFDPGMLPLARVTYTIFIHNAFNFLPFVESCGAPLVFTLYPGGGFQLDDPACDARLRRVFESKSFREVIVTMTITRDYLLSRKLCPPDRMHFLYGGVFSEAMLAPPAIPKRLFGVDKETIDICFVANKYMPGGVDKGYDVFLEVARRLAARRKEVRFHVVGPFDEGDGDVTTIRNRLQFHGYMLTAALKTFYRGMDMILSPNLPFSLVPGGFDGFPTGACVEAALCGVALFCTDPLNLNIGFRDREEIVLITRNVDDVLETVDAYCRDCAKLYQLAAKGSEAFRRALSPEIQLTPRFAMFDQLLRSDG